MPPSLADAYGDDLREFVERLLRVESTAGEEAAAQAVVEDRLDALGFETYRWTADAERLAGHPSFPDDAGEIPVADRPSVAGVLEVGDPAAGPTLTLNAHTDVVPAERDLWSSDPFEPAWDGDDLTARGAADTKAGLGVCVYAARLLADRADDTDDSDDATSLDGRIVVESVAGEEDGGVGAAAAALDNPYPFERGGDLEGSDDPERDAEPERDGDPGRDSDSERGDGPADAAVVVEPTDLTPVVATEGVLMKRLRISGRSAHAATPWRGESVLPHFERIRAAFEDLEAERAESVTHPLYDDFPVPWPVVAGTVEAGSWASTVPGRLDAEFRIGVAPGETVAEVERAFDERLAEVVAADEWLATHPPTFERFSVQFEPAEIDADEPVVRALGAALDARGLDATPRGATYGTDARYLVAAGVPAVVFGPGRIEQAHYPDETVHWPDVLTAGEVLVETGRTLLS